MPWKPRTSSANRSKERRAAYNRERGNSHYAGKAWQQMRKEVFLRDGYKCRHCKKFVGMEAYDAHCDHVIPRGQPGSSEEVSNMQTLCASCHQAKSMKERRA
jgi:5-methylcytosine-specific restriction endonuclease McrA